MNAPIKTKPIRRAPPKLARAGASVFSALAKKTKFADPALADHWPSLAGPEISALCRPGRITGDPRAGRTLEIHCPSGAAAAQLQMQLDALKARVNRYLGPGAIDRILVVQGAAQPQAGAPSKDDPSPLGRALASFRAAVANKSSPENGGK